VNQAALPLFPCEPGATEAGYARCYAFTHDPKHEARNVRVVTRLCPRNECPCPVCLVGDAMVFAFNERQAA
jgi:hypothetical protein